MPSEESLLHNGLPTDLSPELNVLLGVYYLFWTIDEKVDTLKVDSALTSNERHVLITLASPRRMGELATNLQILPSALTAIADELERKGLVTRERDPADRRAWRLILTKKGRALREDIIRKVSQIFNEVSGLNPSETETMSALMLKIAHHIKAKGLPEGGKPCR